MYMLWGSMSCYEDWSPHGMQSFNSMCMPRWDGHHRLHAIIRHVELGSVHAEFIISLHTVVAWPTFFNWQHFWRESYTQDITFWDQFLQFGQFAAIVIRNKVK